MTSLYNSLRDKLKILAIESVGGKSTRAGTEGRRAQIRSRKKRAFQKKGRKKERKKRKEKKAFNNLIHMFRGAKL